MASNWLEVPVVPLDEHESEQRLDEVSILMLSELNTVELAVMAVSAGLLALVIILVVEKLLEFGFDILR